MTWWRRSVVVVLAAIVVLLGLGPGAFAGQAELPPPEPDPSDVRDSADEILSRTEFQEAEPSIWDRVTEWIGERLESLLGDTVQGASGSPVLGYAVLVVALLGVGYLLYRWLRGLRRDASAPDEPAELDAERGYGSTDWRRAAEQCEADAAWKEAMRCRYRVLVTELVEREVVGDAPGRTAGEYRREVADGVPVAAPPFDRATDLFERAWYADEPTGPDENRAIRLLTDEVVEVVG